MFPKSHLFPGRPRGVELIVLARRATVTLNQLDYESNRIQNFHDE